jgi:putative phage-type endonuclease
MSELTREEWLARRRSGIGGSDVAAVLGLSPWKSPRQVWLDKTTDATDDRQTMPMLLGTILEPEVLRLYSEQTGVPVRRSHLLWRHEEHQHLIANVDATAKHRIVEAKTARSRDGWGEPGSDDVPEQYWLQVQHYLYVSGRDFADLAVMFLSDPKPEVSIYTMKPASEYPELVAELNEWWARHVIEGVEPSPYSTSEAAERWRQSRQGSRVDATPAVLESVRQLAAVRAQLKALEQEEEHLKLEIQLHMQDGEQLCDGDAVLATWKSSSSSRLDLGQLRQRYPEQAAECTVASVSRRFLLKGQK